MTGEGSRTGFAAGFDGSMPIGSRPAVVSVDLMRAYFDPESALCLPSKDCLIGAARVIEAARSLGIPVLHTRVRYGPGGRDGGLFIQKVPALRALIGDTRAGEIMPEVAPRDDEEVIVKQYASAFFGTSLASTLMTDRIDTLVLVGTSTSGCVRATAVDAIQLGFAPIVVSDAVGDRDEAVHRASLYDLQAKYAEVSTSEDIVSYFSSR